MLGTIATGVAAAAKVAQSIAERAERGQLIDAGVAKANAETLSEIHERIQNFVAASRAVDADPAFRKLVSDHFTDNDG